MKKYFIILIILVCLSCNRREYRLNASLPLLKEDVYLGMSYNELHDLMGDGLEEAYSNFADLHGVYLVQRDTLLTSKISEYIYFYFNEKEELCVIDILYEYVQNQENIGSKLADIFIKFYPNCSEKVIKINCLYLEFQADNDFFAMFYTDKNDTSSVSNSVCSVGRSKYKEFLIPNEKSQ